eukprot:5119211-Lingulodinium_polyedra.AAC.1
MCIRDSTLLLRQRCVGGASAPRRCFLRAGLAVWWANTGLRWARVAAPALRWRCVWCCASVALALRWR